MSVSRKIKLIQRGHTLLRLSTSIQRLGKHRKTMKEAAIYNDRKSCAKKFNWLIANHKL